MLFTPHTLQIRDATAFSRDEFGRPSSAGEVGWRTIGICRCDDVGAERNTGENGAAYPFRYKVVYPRSLGFIAEGTEVRCLDAEGEVRGQGVVKSPMKTNFLSYRVIWLE